MVSSTQKNDVFVSECSGKLFSVLKIKKDLEKSTYIEDKWETKESCTENIKINIQREMLTKYTKN